MLDQKYLENNLEIVKEKLLQRGMDLDLDFDKLQQLNKDRKDLIVEVESFEHERNQGSKKVGELKREGSDAEAEELSKDMKIISSKIKDLNTKRTEIEDEYRELMLHIPNIPDASTPVGNDESDNQEIKKWGHPLDFDFEIKDHVDLGSSLDILDLPRAAKITGSRFALYKGLGAKLERSLINFMLDIHTNEHGYLEVLPPFIANTASFIGTGNLPKFEEDLFKLNDTDYYLIPTAEVPVTNINSNEILDEEELTKKYVAYTPCFRKEAGSYGKDIHGIFRQHQFNKVELVKLTAPENSYEEHEKLTQDAAKILELLNLPYRIVVLCTGDMGFSSAKTYDIEVWIPSEKRYREISSCSNFESFQARRANIRYRKNKGGKTDFVHTLNGSGVAIGRTFIALLENYQQKDGSVKIPDILVPYMNGVEVIE
ncbi:MAG: serine--tRNA ligase [Thermodesulfobacteriota bacterium]